MLSAWEEWLSEAEEPPSFTTVEGDDQSITIELQNADQYVVKSPNEMMGHSWLVE